MLFWQTVDVYCEKLTELTDILCGQNVEIVPHRKHINSPIQNNRLMLFGERINIYCENHTGHTDTLCEKRRMYRLYLTGNTLRLH
jgi:hypothetical protein